MTDNGHCDHCSQDDTCYPSWHNSTLHVGGWRPGNCDYCWVAEEAATAERARIVAWLTERMKEYSEHERRFGHHVAQKHWADFCGLAISAIEEGPDSIEEYIGIRRAPELSELERIVCFLDGLADEADDAGLLGRRNILTEVKHQIQDGEHRHDR